jgi:hypothetical protein
METAVVYIGLRLRFSSFLSGRFEEMERFLEYSILLFSYDF